MGYRVAVVGATGNVGREMLNILAEREFPVDEIVALGRTGLSSREVLHASTADARNWLGLGAQDVGDSADVVVYPADPAVDPEVLRHPTAVIRAGRIVAGSAAGAPS